MCFLHIIINTYLIMVVFTRRDDTIQTRKFIVYQRCETRSCGLLHKAHLFSHHIFHRYRILVVSFCVREIEQRKII